MVEFLAAEIIAKHFTNRFEEEQPIVWIEHYPPIEAYSKVGKTVQYSLVTCESYTPRRVPSFNGNRIQIGDPDWRYVEEAKVEGILGRKPS